MHNLALLVAREMQGQVRDIELDPCQHGSVSKILFPSHRKKSGLQCEYCTVYIEEGMEDKFGMYKCSQTNCFDVLLST